MDRKLAVRLLFAAALLALATSLYYLTKPYPSATRADSSAARRGASTSPGNPATATRPPHTSSAAPGSLDDLHGRIQSGEAGLVELAALRERLLAAPADEAIAEIQRFLDAGKDAGLRSGFEIGEDGGLAGAPSLRVYLLDLMGQIARKSGSDAAAKVAREVLEKKTSPEEWAVSMRNVAWHDGKAKPYLAAKMREMLAYQPWTQNPSDGLLEAFDVIVYTGDPSFIPQLAQFRGGEVPDMERAAVVAMDRLSESSPLEVMNYLNSHPREFADLPLVRADFYTRADLNVPAQRAAVETYLARTDVTLEEKTKLLGGLASPATFISDNLLTPTPSPDDDISRLQSYATVLQQWQQQTRFAPLQGQMSMLAARLQEQLQ